MKNPSLVKAVFSRATPFCKQDFIDVFQIFESSQFRPERFGTFEPLRTMWGVEEEFLLACKQEMQGYFGTIILHRKRPKFLFNFVILFGPKAKAHNVWLNDVLASDVGGEQCPILLDFLDLIFETLNMDYGFVCTNGEYAVEYL